MADTTDRVLLDLISPPRLREDVGQPSGRPRVICSDLSVNSCPDDGSDDEVGKYRGLVVFRAAKASAV
jgi:hypothetical protein